MTGKKALHVVVSTSSITAGTASELGALGFVYGTLLIPTYTLQRVHPCDLFGGASRPCVTNLVGERDNHLPHIHQLVFCARLMMRG